MHDRRPHECKLSAIEVTAIQDLLRVPLFGNRTITFACDEHGNVDLDGLSEPDRCDYLFARIMMRSGWVHPRILPR